MKEQDIAQCASCGQIYHRSCWELQKQACQCALDNCFVQLSKKNQAVDLKFSFENESQESQKMSTKRTKGTAQIEQKECPVKTVDERQKRILSLYDTQFPLNFNTETEKQRKKVRRVFMELLAGTVAFLLDSPQIPKFDFSISKVDEMRLLGDAEVTDYLIAICTELEAELFRQNQKPNDYVRKSRFFSLTFKQDRTNSFWVQLIVRKMGAKELLALQERDFSDKELIAKYEKKFWDGRELVDDEIVLKNHKGLVDLEKETSYVPDSEFYAAPIEIGKGLKGESSTVARESGGEFFKDGKVLKLDRDHYDQVLGTKIDEELCWESALELKDKLFRS